MGALWVSKMGYVSCGDTVGELDGICVLWGDCG